MTVGCVEGVGDLPPVLEGELVRERALRELLSERLSFDKLHDQKVRSVLTSDVLERADVRVIQLGYGARLPLKALASVLLRSEFGGKDLDGDETLEPGVPGLVHLSHATCPD
jgi:hypothetical protein